MREKCWECTRKHIGQAAVLLDEVEYPHHKILAIGHLAEAESECPNEDLRKMIREYRKDVDMGIIGQIKTLLQTAYYPYSIVVYVDGELIHEEHHDKPRQDRVDALMAEFPYATIKHMYMGVQ